MIHKTKAVDWFQENSWRHNIVLSGSTYPNCNPDEEYDMDDRFSSIRWASDVEGNDIPYGPPKCCDDEDKDCRYVEEDCPYETLSGPEAEIIQANRDYRMASDGIDFCMESKYLLEHFLSASRPLFKRSFGHHKPGLRAKREHQWQKMVDEMSDCLVSGVWKEPDRDYLQLVNSRYKVPDPEHADSFVSPREIDHGLPVGFYPVKNLYNSSNAPWYSPRYARNYLRRLDGLVAALQRHQASAARRLGALVVT
ncbi:MAG: hypothetical protein M0003_17935 [Acidithiobacillus sp.]|nr:hypothetical protein [Acidithiobacillus sp.]